MGSTTSGLELKGEVDDTSPEEQPASAAIARLTRNRCPDITHKLVFDQSGRIPVLSGGFGDIYQGVLTGGEEVAIKCIRIYAGPDNGNRHKVVKHIARELHVWSHLKHENILELLGLARFQGHISMVSPWMENGNLLEYVNYNPNVDRYQLAIHISEGVMYLHQNDVVHGDIKSGNILISDKGVAKLADFGCTELKKSTLHFTTTTSAAAFSTRWAAPEILQGAVEHSTEGDVYALGMALLELITGVVPFNRYRQDQAVYVAVAFKREMPNRPTGYPSFMKHERSLFWNLMRWTWSYEPSVRPRSNTINHSLKSFRPSFPGQYFIVFPDVYFFDKRGIAYQVRGQGLFERLLSKNGLPSTSNIFHVGERSFSLNTNGELLQLRLSDGWTPEPTYPDLRSARSEVALQHSKLVANERAVIQKSGDESPGRPKIVNTTAISCGYVDVKRQKRGASSRALEVQEFVAYRCDYCSDRFETYTHKNLHTEACAFRWTQGTS